MSKEQFINLGEFNPSNDSEDSLFAFYKKARYLRSVNTLLKERLPEHLTQVFYAGLEQGVVTLVLTDSGIAYWVKMQQIEILDIIKKIEGLHTAREIKVLINHHANHPNFY